MSKESEWYRIFLMVCTFIVCLLSAIKKEWLIYWVLLVCFIFEVVEAKGYLKKERSKENE